MIHSTETHSVNTKTQEYLSGWQRARAELANFRTRISNEQGRKDKQTKRQIIQDLMPLVDNFQAMTDHVPPELADNAWTQGVLHIAKQLEQLLAQYNVEPIKADGAQFDPNLHEAISSVKNKKFTSGHIIEVLQPGYIMGNDVIRPAKVKVAK